MGLHQSNKRGYFETEDSRRSNGGGNDMIFILFICIFYYFDIIIIVIAIIILPDFRLRTVKHVSGVRVKNVDTVNSVWTR